jgi:hypothetical protein
MSALNRFLGDSPLRILLKLAVVSFIVGLVMSAFGWSPLDIFYGVQRFLLDLWHLGFDSLGRLFGYMVLGAAVVVPAFLVIRLLSYRR